jgi:hypothetical protein
MLYFSTHLLGSKTPFCLKTSAKMGTVELTGFEMIPMKALGQCSAQATAKSRTIEALVFYISLVQLNTRIETWGTHEKIISGHSWLPGDTSGDDDELSTSQSLLDATTSATYFD